MPSHGEAATIAWSGAEDSNWNTASNWVGGIVPGTGSNDVAVLAGVNDSAVVATPVVTTNFCTLKMRQEASLKICADIRLRDILLGANAGAGGAHVTQMAGVTPAVAVDDDLRVGDHADATTPSSYTIGGGSLTVGDEIYIDKGTFKVDGPEASINAENLTLTTNGSLHFDFDWQGVSPIVVSNAFTVADGATLTIDLRGYTAGGNMLELVRFNSMNGSFDPADITITGLAGGTVTNDADSLNLIVVDEQEDPINTLWFIATGGTGTGPDLRVNTGRRIRDITSPLLSWTPASDGDDLLYSVSWSGSDFDSDGFNDVITFDLRVEGFSGSTYTYSTNAGESSMTALGTSAGVVSSSGAWGVGSDADMDAGESLRFSVENLHFSVAGGSRGLDGFVALRIEEPNGGNSHKLVLGQGTGLDSVTWNRPKDFGFRESDPLVITSAGSTKVALGHVAIKFTVSDPPDSMTADSNDFSGLPTGPGYRPDYAPQTNFTNFPEFSWDIVPRWGNVNSKRLLTDEEAEQLANRFQIMTMGGISKFGMEFVEDGALATAAKLKSFNPNLKIQFYRNSQIHFRGFRHNELYDEDEWSLYTLDENGDRVYDMIRSYRSFNHSYPEMRQWWIDICVDMVSRPEFDGVFIDKANDQGYPLLNEDGQLEPSTDRLQMYYDLVQQLPEGALLNGNILRNERPGGNRELMRMFHGSYLERWDNPDGDSTVAHTEADARCASIQLMREAAVKGKYLTPNLHDRLDNAYISEQIDAGNEIALIEEIKARVTLSLAYFLIVAEQYSYFRYAPDQNVSKYPEYIWDPTDYVPELTYPLGPPQGPPVKNGYIYTRSFQHVDVWLDVENETAVLTWDSEIDSDGDELPDGWEYQHFGSKTGAVATANSDSDQYNNLAEFILGLDPNVADEFPISISSEGANITFEWDKIAGRIYNIYWSTNLRDYTLVGSNVLHGTFTTPVDANEPLGFYRLEVLVEP